MICVLETAPAAKGISLGLSDDFILFCSRERLVDLDSLRESPHLHIDIRKGTRGDTFFAESLRLTKRLNGIVKTANPFEMVGYLHQSPRIVGFDFDRSLKALVLKICSEHLGALVSDITKGFDGVFLAATVSHLCSDEFSHELPRIRVVSLRDGSSNRVYLLQGSFMAG